MDPTTAQIIAEAQKHLRMASALLSKLSSVSEQPEEQIKDVSAEIQKKLRMLLYSDKWPVAVDPRHMADPNSDEDKLTRASAILDQIVGVNLANKRFLDFGCGEGHVAFLASDAARLSIGYDLTNQGWGQFPLKDNLLLMKELDYYTGFDVILLHDVLDHADDPKSVLSEIRNLLDDEGRVCVFCHPFSSRTGGHNHRDLNRAYAQLFFPQNHIGQKVLRPLEDYKPWFEDAGFVVQHERPSYYEVPKLFHITQLADRIKDLYGDEKFPEEHMRIDGIVYTLSKEL